MNNLTQRLVALGLTQEEVRDRIRATGTPVSLNTVKNWFGGHTDPGKKHIGAIAQVLDLTDAELGAIVRGEG